MGSMLGPTGAGLGGIRISAAGSRACTARSMFIGLVGLTLEA
jgi:hypothetical protein